MRLFLLLSILTILPVLVQAQASLDDVNFSYLYNPDSEIDVWVGSYRLDDYVEVNVKLIKYQKKASFEDYSFSIYTAGSYNQKIHLISDNHIDSILLKSTNTDLHWKFSLPLEVSEDMLVVEVQSKFSGLNYYFETRAHPDRIVLEDNVATEQFEPWVAAGIYQINSTVPVFGYFYNYDFPPALPPMPTDIDIPEKDMKIDSTFRLATGESIRFSKTGLYLVQQDTNTNRALSFRVESKYYPKLVKLESLARPLIYITTKEENEKLQNINGEKKKFDKFWLDVTNSPERAKIIIKNYFDRVEYANRFFTQYKEGWKTDMGMIYIIFGPPDEVKKSEDGQIWTYLSDPQLPKTKFRFIRAENIFSSESYVLVREKKNAPVWYRAVDLWRKGRF